MGVSRSVAGSMLISAIAGLLLAGCGGGGLSDAPDSISGQPTGRSAAVVTLEQTLADLAALPVPADTDAELFDRLKAELSRSLQSAGNQRFTAAAPQSAAGKVTNLQLTANADGTATFTFSYCNAGDYNQDGLVYISDLSAIGQQWEKTTGSADWQIAQLADGNNDGMVTISDITPIGQNYLAMVKGYALFTAAGAGGVASGAEVNRIAMSTGESPAGGGPLVFSFTIDEPDADYYYAVRPYDDAGTGVLSNTIKYVAPSPAITGVSPTYGRSDATITMTAGIQGGIPDTYNWNFGGAGMPNASADAQPELTLCGAGTYQASLTVGNSFGTDTFDFEMIVNANQQPVASLFAAITEGPAPLSVNLDAAGSHDNDGLIVGYEWDWEGDGTWDHDSGAVPQAQHTYSNAGTYLATVRVTDDSGETNSTTLQITVTKSGNWNLLVWVAADNNLAEAAFDDITEMEQIGSTAHINVLAGYDIDPEWCNPGLGGIDQVHFIKVVQDFNANSINITGDPANTSFPRAGYNSADPAKLIDFLNWAETNHPAERTALILWDHGSGWRVGEAVFGAGAEHRPRGRDTSGVLGDDADGEYDLTSNGALISALSGRSFDLLAFDACSMADIESLHEYRALSPWIIASEALVPFDGFEYQDTLQEWNNQQPDAETVGRIFIDDYMDRYTGFEKAQLALLDTSKIPAAVTALGNFAAAVKAKAASESTNVENALLSAYDTWGEGTRDAIGFLESFKTNTSDGALQGLTDSAITACNNLVVYSAQYNMAGANGLGVFLPDETWWGNSLINEYDGLAFDQATGWLDMLRATVAYETLPVYDWVPGDHVLISWYDFQAGLDQGIFDPNLNLGYNWAPEPVAQSIFFGLDDQDIGIPEEYAELKVGALSGDYYITIWWWWYDTYFPPPIMPVHMRIYDSNWNLKEDLGTFNIWYGEEHAVVILQN